MLHTVVCQGLPPLQNGVIKYCNGTIAPYIEGTRATHTCDTGFVLNGTINRTCQNDGFFDGAPPTCESESVLHLSLTALNTLYSSGLWIAK